MAKTNRRNFLKTSALGVVGAGALGVDLSGREGEEPQADFPKIKEYRLLGRTGFKASDIGIGTSRMYPTPVLKALLDAGVNYIDTAEGYGRGVSETNVGQAIQGRDRKSLFITTKMHLKAGTGKEEILKRFQGCVDRLKTDYVDALMMHGVPTVAALNEEGFHQATAQLKAEGRIRFIGVSNHGPRNDQGESMEKVLTAAAADGRYDVMLLVYNFLKREAGEKILAACVKNNVGATIMKSDPVGRYYSVKERIEKMKQEGKEVEVRMSNYLTRMKKSVDEAQDFIKKHNLNNPAEIKNAAIRFVLSNPGVNSLCLAFNTFEDVENYLKLSGTRLSGRDKKTLAAYERGCGAFYCRHACGVCESSCPRGVAVNTIMRYNHYFEAHGNEKYAMEKYARLDAAGADRCAGCVGHCEAACPHGVPVRALLGLAHSQLTLA